MGVKALIGSSVAGLGLLALSLFTPVIPTNTYTFTAQNGSKCEVEPYKNQYIRCL